MNNNKLSNFDFNNIYLLCILTLSAFLFVNIKNILSQQQDIQNLVILWFLRIFNGLLQTKSVKKYILTE